MRNKPFYFLKRNKLPSNWYLVLVTVILSNPLFSQFDGLIIDPATGASAAVLDPNSDGYVSATTAGFLGDDQLPANNELPWLTLIPFGSEPNSDVQNGPDCGFTDFVESSSGGVDPVFHLSDGTNWLFRFRMASVAPNSKSYSILVDIDNLIGPTDDCYLAGINPGFEMEIVLETGFGVTIYDHRLSCGSNEVVSYPEERIQKSVAATSVCTSLNYFLEFYVDWADITAQFGINENTVMRYAIVSNMAAQKSTICNPNSASDIGGVDDGACGSLEDCFTEIITNQPGCSPSATTTCVYSDCPSINGSPLQIGATTIDVTTTETDGTLNVYVDGVLSGSTTITGAGTYTITLAGALLSGEVVTATAQATGEVESGTNCNNVEVAGATCTDPAVITDASAKGFCGTGVDGATIRIYYYGPSGVTEVFSSPTYAWDGLGTFLWKCNGNGTGCSSGSAQCLCDGAYGITQQAPGQCESQPTFACVDRTGNTPGCSDGNPIATSSPTITSSHIPGTSTVTGTMTGADDNIAGITIIVYVNGFEIGSTTTDGNGDWSYGTHTFSSCDTITAIAINNASMKCVSPESNAVVVSSGASDPPVIDSGLCGTTNTISGTSSEEDGTIIEVFDDGVSVGTTTVLGGQWELSGLTISEGSFVTATALNQPYCETISAASTSELVGTQNTNTITIDQIELIETDVLISGTGTSGDIVTLYIDGWPLYLDFAETTPATSTVSGGTWSVTLSEEVLYAGGVVTAQGSNGSSCNSVDQDATPVICEQPDETLAVNPDTTTICSGTAVTNVEIVNSQLDIVYLLYDNGSPSGAAILGNGANIILESAPLSSNTTLIVEAIKFPFDGSCTTSLLDSVTVLVIPPPTISYIAQANPTVCGASDGTITISGLENSQSYTVNYDLDGLPNSGVFNSDGSGQIVISGLSSGTYTNITTIGLGCNSNNTLAGPYQLIDPDNTVSTASASPQVCLNVPMTAVTHSTTGATGIGTPTNLPNGVTAAFSTNTITISGTPTTSGIFNYSIPLTGGCGTVFATGTIEVFNAPANGTDVITACDSYTWIDGITYTASNNTATHTLIGGSVNGCDSIVTLNLTLNTSSTGTDVIAACNSYTWIDGITYTTSNNTATHTLTNAAGCDSVVTLDLTISTSVNGTDVITACDSYTWIDGIIYTASNNTATHTLVGGSVNGCDSIVTLNLTLNTSSTGTDVITACNSYTWIDGNTYTTSNNTATHTLTNAAGCDSLVTLDLTISTSVNGTDVITSCDSYTWIDGITYTASNNTATHTLVGGSVNGCDSIVTLNLTLNTSSTGTDIITACNSYTWIDGITYTTSNNTATHTLTNAAGCDSVVTLDLTISTAVNGTDVITACDSYTWIDGITYTTSNNTATHTFVGGSMNGCDSIVTLNLTLNTSSTGTDVITACNSYTWIDGITYTASNNTATHTLTNAAGCDSVVTLDLTISTSVNGTDVITACDSYTWIDGITYAASNNTATHTLIGGSVNGCDSIVTLNLTLNTSSTGTDVITACNSYTWIDGITYTTSNNTATHTLTNAAGCDSVVTLDLTISTSVNGTDVITACDSYTWIDGITYTASNNTATHTLIGGSVNGCDSIVTLNLTLNTSSTGADVITACNSYTWIDGVTYTTSNNTATHTLIGGSVNGCDSIVTLNLTLSTSSTGTDVITACNSYTWIDGITYTTSNNTATHTLTNAAGCDSLVTLDLTISTSVNGTDVITACDSYTWIDGITYTASNNTATHTLVGGSVNGCDSIVTLNLTLNTSSTGTDVITTCNSYTWIDGITYTTSNNTATHTLTNAAGCDSVVTLDLTISTTVNGTDVITACDSYTWIDGITYTASNNTATHTLIGGSVNGCDSIVTLNLTLNTSSSGTDVITACNSYTWIDGITYTTSNNTATHTLANAAGCDSVVTLDLTISTTVNGTDVITACDSYTWIDGVIYTASNNTATHTLIGGSVNGCDSVVSLDLTINYATNFSFSEEICLGESYEFGSQTLTSAGTYSETFIGTNGCDSTVVLQLSINTNDSDNDGLTDCEEIYGVDDPSTPFVPDGPSDPNDPCSPLPCDLDVPDGFTPNGDNINEFFVIEGLDAYPGNTFTVFNRWGTKVYYMENYDNSWGGSVNVGGAIGNDLLPTGTYFYILDTKDDSIGEGGIVQGYIYIQR